MAQKLAILILLVSTLSLATAAPDTTPTPVVSKPARANNTHCVHPAGDHDCYTTIQAAVNAATSGDTINIAQGAYTSTNTAVVLINHKDLYLYGGWASDFSERDPNTYTTTIDGQSNRIGINVQYATQSTIDGLKITHCDGGESGGGIAITSNNITATIQNNTITNNHAWWGGGIQLEIMAGTATLQNNIISYNNVGSAECGFGGGIGTLGADNTTIQDNILIGNWSNCKGGAIGLDTADNIAISGNTISNNEGGDEGGGLFIYKSDVVLTNNIIVDNEVESDGGGIYAWNSSLQLLHNTIARNTANNGICANSGSAVTLINTILSSHTTGIYVTSGSTATLDTTLWFSNSTNTNGPGTTNRVNDHFGDPAFLDPDIGNYHIGPNSAAIDTGTNTGITTDIDRDPRPLGNGYDIGADEYLPNLVYLPLITTASMVSKPVRLAAAPDTTPPWWTWPCNTPPETFVDGCGEPTAIQQPAAPLPPPCIRAATLITVANDDRPAYTDLILRIVVDHPEYTAGVSQTVDVRHPLHGYIGPPGSTLLPPFPWQTDVGDWSYKCARDEAPLAWAVAEILNTRSFGPASLAYSRALPRPLLDILANVEQIPINHLYLPFVAR